MTDFSYSLRNNDGKSIHGRVEADSLEEAAQTVARPGWFITSLGLQTKSNALVFSFAEMSSVERIVFTDHLAEMISSGTPIIEALTTYKEEENTKSSALITDLVASITQGKKLSEALATHPKVFSPYYVAVVRSGELTGRIDESFHYLARELRREFEFQEKIKSAMLYPTMVLIVALGVMMLLVFLVIPKITELTKSFGGELPLATRIVSDIATFISANAVGMLVSTLVLGVIGIILFRLPDTRTRLEPWLLKLPLVGTILRHYQLSRFLRILGSSVEYGISLATACEMVGTIVTNSVYKSASFRLKERITKGMGIAEALSLENPYYFPSFIVRSLRGAERTGSLSKALQRIATFYENDVDRNLHRLTELIQPVLTIILGLIVGAIALSVVAPIYQITSKIR